MFSAEEIALCDLAVLRNKAREKALEGFTQEAYDAGTEFLLAWQTFHEEYDTLPIVAEVFLPGRRIIACMIPGSIKFKQRPEYSMTAWWRDEDGDLVRAPNKVVTLDTMNTFIDLVNDAKAVLVFHDIREGSTLLPEMFYYAGTRKFRSFWASRLPAELMDAFTLDSDHAAGYDEFLDTIQTDRSMYFRYRTAVKNLSEAVPGGKCPACGTLMRIADSLEEANVSNFTCPACHHSELLSEEATLHLLEEEILDREPSAEELTFIEEDLDNCLIPVYLSDYDDTGGGVCVEDEGYLDERLDEDYESDDDDDWWR